ncbi:MAG: hydrogenase 4 subunit F [Terriglobia bacterium]|jgi:hydrogenase-4 component F|nr:hydrogenase 4 subunit F [Terriglobia bacterium]
MVLIFPLLVPIVAACVMFWCRKPVVANVMAMVFGGLELIAIGNAVWATHRAGTITAGHYLRADGLTSFFLINLGLIFALVLAYSVGYLRHIPEGRFSSPRWFYGLVFLFLFTMMAVYLSANLGMMWIFVEATTLASALLVGFYNTEGAVEAGWKYLILCTVGIAFALFGTIALYLAAVRSGVNPESALDWATLMSAAPGFSGVQEVLKLAFVFVAVGYGTKIGFVPMHSWLPDAHAEAPSPISALLSAVLLNCALYALLRFEAITSLAMGHGFSRTLLLIFGGLSVTVAALLMVVQRNLKRLLAYSSIEHMGIVAIGVGLGGPLGLYGALLHAFNHSIAKTLLFFSAGSVRENFGTLQMDRIRGMARALPWTSTALVIGSIAIVGLPPFGLFVSEFVILTEAFAEARFMIAIILLVALSIVFGALLYHFQRMLAGEAERSIAGPRMLISDFGVMGICAGCLLVLGVRIPTALTHLLQSATTVLHP